MSKKEYTTDELDGLYQEWSDTVLGKYNEIIFPKLQELAERARLVQDPSEFAGLVMEFMKPMLKLTASVWNTTGLCYLRTKNLSANKCGKQKNMTKK